MSFYLEIPTYSIPISFAIELMKDRLNLENSSIFDITLDYLSHHLQALCFSKNQELWNLFLQNECQILQSKLKEMNCKQHILFWMKIKLKLKTLSIFKNSYKKVFLPIFLQSNIINKINYAYHKKSDLPIFHVPFKQVARLLSKRNVVLKKGIAYITRLNLHEFLIESLYIILNGRRSLYYKIYRHLEKYDKRFCKILQIFQIILSQKQFSINSVSSLNIDNEQKYFPPCMSYLHKKLRFVHRLDHHSRIRYSLFLKSIGLSYEEALKFWKDEYSREKCTQHNHANNGLNSHTSCNHTWQDLDYSNYQGDAKRYHYNLRHLYGLEGSRKNYACQSCTHIQEQIQKPLDSSGCPFLHFPSLNLKSYLLQDVKNSILPNGKDDLNQIVRDIEDICNNVQNISPSLRCHKFLFLKRSLMHDTQYSSNTPTTKMTFKSPDQYYMAIKYDNTN